MVKPYSLGKAQGNLPYSQYETTDALGTEAQQGDGGASFSAPAASALAPGLSSALIAALSDTVQAVKGVAGRLYGVDFYNATAVDVFVQVFDKAADVVVLGTDVPKRTFWVPSRTGRSESWPVPLAFGTAISMAATTTATGSAAPPSGVLAQADYK